MITGAWKAARHERQRFRRIKGYGSQAFSPKNQLVMDQIKIKLLGKGREGGRVGGSRGLSVRLRVRVSFSLTFPLSSLPPSFLSSPT
jgi:hypothetical protein